MRLCAGGYSHESVGLPPITRVPSGETMHMNEIRKLGQSSLITEWGRQGHSFTRYGVAGAVDVDFKPQTATLLESLDAAAAAGVSVLVDVGVDRYPPLSLRVSVPLCVSVSLCVACLTPCAQARPSDG